MMYKEQVSLSKLMPAHSALWEYNSLIHYTTWNFKNKALDEVLSLILHVPTFGQLLTLAGVICYLQIYSTLFHPLI